MFDDDNAARHALQAIADDPAPPVATTVDQVLRRGRRRVFVQRVAAAAGVMAVVAAIGVGAMLLRPGYQSGGVQVGDSDPAAPPGLTTTAQSDTSTPQGPPATPLLPGGTNWQPVDMPADADSGSGCAQMEQPPPDREVALLPEETVKVAFSNAIAKTTGNQPASVTSEWQEHSPKQSGAPSGFVSATVSMDNGIGELQLEALRFGGTPVEFADWARTSYGNCEPPWRRVLADGTVLQLFQADDGNAKAPMQHLQIFRPDGRRYIITSAGFTESDIDRDTDGSGTVAGGRGELPVDALQLGDIAERLVSNLR
jgi:hypothetical protein